MLIHVKLRYVPELITKFQGSYTNFQKQMEITRKSRSFISDFIFNFHRKILIHVSSFKPFILLAARLAHSFSLVAHLQFERRNNIYVKVKVKFSRYSPEKALRDPEG